MSGNKEKLVYKHYPRDNRKKLRRPKGKIGYLLISTYLLNVILSIYTFNILSIGLWGGLTMFWGYMELVEYQYREPSYGVEPTEWKIDKRW